MSEQYKSSLTFKNYRVKYVEFKLNERYEYKGVVDIDLKINRNIEITEPGKKGKVEIETTISEDSEKNNYPFYMKVVVEGDFLGGEEAIDNEMFEKLLNYNAVSILFPYVRSIISTYTAQANVPPLILPPINVTRI